MISLEILLTMLLKHIVTMMEEILLLRRAPFGEADSQSAVAHTLRSGPTRSDFILVPEKWLPHL
jgi:hypothetical protein